MEEQRRKRHWTLSPKQLAFVQSPSTFTFFAGGVGSGKTFAGAAKAIITALSDEYAGALGVIVAPTYPMLEDATLRVFLELMPEAAVKTFKKSPSYTMELHNGSIILFRSLDKPDALRGTNIAWYWDDEAPYGGYYAWKVLKARLRQNRRDGTPYRVKAWATGTPKGMDEFYEDFDPTSGKRKGDHLLIRSASWENRYLREGYVESLGYDGTFYDQEVLGEFKSFEGLVYKTWDPTPGSGHVRTPGRGLKFERVIGGIDWGYNHPAALLAIGIDAEDRLWVLDEFVEARQALHERLIPEMLRMTRTYNVGIWWCDGALPGNVVEVNRALDNARANCLARAAVKGPDSVVEGIQSVQHALAPRGRGANDGFGLYVADRCKKTIKEFGQYQYEVTPEGRAPKLLGMEKPVKLNDDAMDALRYAVHMTFGKGRNAPVPAVWAETPSADDALDPIARALKETAGTDAYTILREALERAGVPTDLDDALAAQADLEEQLAARRQLTARMLSSALLPARPRFGGGPGPLTH